MKSKNLLLTVMFFLFSFSVFSQKNPYSEILVFFNQGVSQKVMTTNGKTKKIAFISNPKLKSSLNSIGIDESMLEIAIPEFNPKDTLKVLADGHKLYQADMSKLYKINVPKDKNRYDFIKQLSLTRCAFRTNLILNY